MTSNEPDSVDIQDANEEYLEQLAKDEEAAADDYSCPACGDYGHWMPCDYDNEYVFECYTCGYVG